LVLSIASPLTGLSLQAPQSLASRHSTQLHVVQQLSSVADALLQTDQSSQVNMTMTSLLAKQVWAESMPALNRFEGTAFYPFAGADLITAKTLFPKARSLVMTALFSVGECNYHEWQSSDIESKARDVNLLLFSTSYSQFGYFATQEMFWYMENPGHGIAPLLLAGLRFLGFTPLSMECGGSPRLSASSFSHPPNETLRITYFSEAEPDQVFELFYAKLDMLTPSKQLDSFFEVLESKAPLATMLKATGYVLRRHVDLEYNKRSGVTLHPDPITKFILNSSDVIFQDDSGIAASCLQDWSVSLYGNYGGPASLTDVPLDMKTDYDPTLHFMMCNQHVTRYPLPVHFGYPFFYSVHACPQEQNLQCREVPREPKKGWSITDPTWSKGNALLATRKGVVSQSPALLQIEQGVIADVVELVRKQDHMFEGRLAALA